MDIASKLFVKIRYPPNVNKARLVTEPSNVLFFLVKKHLHIMGILYINRKFCFEGGFSVEKKTY